MATIVINSRRIGAKSTRLRLNSIDLKDSVGILRKQVSQGINVPSEEIELIYCGRILQDVQTVDFYDIKEGSTVHALKKMQTTPAASGTEACHPSAVSDVIAGLQLVMVDPKLRHTLEKLLINPEMVQKVISATPGLVNDPVAFGILQEPDVLAVIAETPENVRKAIESHPCLAQAVSYLTKLVKEEAGNTRLTGFESDDEDLITGIPSRSRLRAAQQAQAGQPPMITANQLAAALATASGPSGIQASAGSSTPNSQPVSNEMFMQAMLQAATASRSQQPSASTQTNQADYRPQLQALRDMGITDESLALQALQRTGGNLDAALDFIFGDGNI